ncbi:MAG: hypothetical protein J6L90_00820, partial [Clostridia bacterium]|nr:hypothetical protein [Clostridia bacterium]
RGTATCDKAGQPNDVCPRGQVMSASPNDVANGCDVVPSAQWANITSPATIGSNIITSKASNIVFAQAKTSFFYRPKVKRKYNTLYLAGKEVCKKDEKNLVLFELNITALW